MVNIIFGYIGIPMTVKQKNGGDVVGFIRKEMMEDMICGCHTGFRRLEYKPPRKKHIIIIKGKDKECHPYETSYAGIEVAKQVVRCFSEVGDLIKVDVSKEGQMILHANDDIKAGLKWVINYLTSEAIPSGEKKFHVICALDHLRLLPFIEGGLERCIVYENGMLDMNNTIRLCTNLVPSVVSRYKKTQTYYERRGLTKSRIYCI
jgi:hypothetical protein